ncbi:MAG: hypothetical protein KDC95_00475 [Planctomycetes bacterium]|nr:hypothetical protein [Planctomycetota bacterium]
MLKNVTAFVVKFAAYVVESDRVVASVELSSTTSRRVVCAVTEILSSSRQPIAAIVDDFVMPCR